MPPANSMFLKSAVCPAQSSIWQLNPPKAVPDDPLPQLKTGAQFTNVTINRPQSSFNLSASESHTV